MSDLLGELSRACVSLRDEMRRKHDRRVPFGDLVTDRWENARAYGFGDGTSCYDSVLVLGDVKVGTNTWIGPNVILDGRGSLVIGAMSLVHSDIPDGARAWGCPARIQS